MRAAGSFDQIPCRVDFVRSIDSEVHMVNINGILNGDAMLSSQHARLIRGGYADDLELFCPYSLAKEFNEKG
jgi:hypothetical protein